MSSRPVKGGVWKNTEDEILKVAVMKYGKNQWARISSLLVRKTPKQCKARWYEWLDPSIKKTEWSKEEDEKLLHLAKVMPTQWRTIAPLVGRTTTQCLERYQKLLDDAERAEDEEGDGAPTADEVRRLRPGEMDPDPESKPARPDAIDMDEDEKEMLSEARARLANTQGKKAKRKARERQLEEARRLATIQKRRELKAAGIDVNTKRKRKRGEVDYNAEIPFEHRVPAGLFDTSDERVRRVNPLLRESKLLEQYEGKSKLAKEEEAMKRDAARKKRHAENAKNNDGGEAAAASARLERLAAENAVSKRVRLQLPAPQIGDAEMEEIVKQGLAGEEARGMADSDLVASEQLLSDYTPLGRVAALRTPRTAQANDSVRQSARDMLALNRTETPLLGGENTPLHDERLGGSATPRHQVASTPSALLVRQQQQRHAQGASATPMGSLGGKTPLRTPRDGLNINTPGGFSMTTSGATPREARLQLSQARQLLDEAFAAMPKPKNDFEIVAPAIEDDGETTKAVPMEMDAEDRDMQAAQADRDSESLRLAQFSEVTRRGLPRASVLRVQAPPASGGTAVDLIDAELAALITHENCADPPMGGAPVADADGQAAFEAIEPARMAAARELLRAEIGAVQREAGWADPALLTSAYVTLVEEMEKNVVFLRNRGQHVDLQTAEPKELCSDMRSNYDELKRSLLAVGAKSQKQQKKLGILLGGHMARCGALTRQVAELAGRLADAEVERAAFELRQRVERQTLPVRTARLLEEVEAARRAQSAAQHRYRDAVDRRRARASVH